MVVVLRRARRHRGAPWRGRSGMPTTAGDEPRFPIQSYRARATMDGVSVRECYVHARCWRGEYEVGVYVWHDELIAPFSAGHVANVRLEIPTHEPIDCTVVIGDKMQPDQNIGYFVWG